VASIDAALYRLWPRSDGDLLIEYLSDDTETLFELPADELARRLNSGSLPLFGVDENRFYTTVGESLTGSNGWQAEFGYIGPRSGWRRWLRTANFPQRSPDGKLHFLAVVIDITRAKRAETEAGEAYRQLTSHLDKIPLAVIEWDAKARVRRWNAQAEDLFGWTADEAFGRTQDDLALLHPGDRQRIVAAVRDMLAGEQPMTVLVNRNVRKDGREILVEWHNSVLLDEAGRPASYLSFALDVTAQKQLEAELAISEERLRLALRASGSVAWEVDRRTGRMHLSEHYGEFFGVAGISASPDRHDALAVVHPDDRERVRGVVGEAVASGQKYAVEFRGAADAADGQPRWFVANGRPLPTDCGVRSVGVTTEVTARKRAEREREELDRQLNEARRYESLGVLAGGLAHDFNNLLTVILGNTALLRATGLPMPDRPLIEIEAACQRAAHLCRQMTAYAGVGRLTISPLDPLTLLRQLEPILRSDAGHARLTITTPTDLPPLAGEPFQVRQAVRNLVTNAEEASPPGGWVRVECERRTVHSGECGEYVLVPAPGEYLVIRVADAGCGMTPEVKAKAFDPFFSTKFAGRGLGLAAVLGIVRGHGGGVRLTSALERGTVIELLFPVAREVADTPLPPLSGAFPRPTATIPPPAYAGTVLVCDDELNIRELIASVLEAEGFRVVRARDGVEGVSAFAAEPGAFALAVVDLLMPGLGGHDVIRQLRSARPGLPAVLVTGFADRELPADVRTAGPTTLLPKPFRLDHLSAAVRSLLAPSA
jgi:PAS domain S-box-containing protein